MNKEHVERVLKATVEEAQAKGLKPDAETMNAVRLGVAGFFRAVENAGLAIIDPAAALASKDETT